jgi:outer membrane protein TolC
VNEIAKGTGVILIVFGFLTGRILCAEEPVPTDSVDKPAVQIESDEVMMSEHTVERIDLETALTRVLEDNIDLALARANEAAAQSRVSGGKSAFFPELEADAGFSFVDGTVQGSFGDFRDINARGHHVGVGIVYGVNIGEQVKELAALRKDLDATVFESLAVEQRLILRVVELYENLVLSKAGVNIARQLVADAESFEHIARVRAQAGVGLGADVARAEANVANTGGQLEEAREVWRQTSIRLATVLRKDPAVLLDPKDAELTEWRVAETQGNQTLEAAVENRPDIEAARRGAQAASDRVQAARWDLFGPTLTAEAGLSGVGGRGERPVRDRLENLSDAIGGFARGANNWQMVFAEDSTTPISTPAGSMVETFYDYRDLFRESGQRVDLQSRTNFTVGLAWSLSFKKRDRLREQRVRREIAQLEVERLEDRAAGELRAAQSAMDSSSRRIEFALDELQAAETNHRIAQARFREGTAIALEVLDAQQVIAQARLNLARHVVDFNLAQARLLAAAGSINTGDFRGISIPE